MRTLFVVLSLLLFPATSAGQAIPPPTGDVVFCGSQATPTNVESYELVFDGGPAAPLTMDATLDSGCPAGATHSFRLPATRFTVGQHTLVVRSLNQFGVTVGPIYTVTVGIAPGQFTITSVRVGG